MRTKGAKNKPKSKEYHLQRLKDLGMNIAENNQNLEITMAEKAQQKAKEKLEIAKPKIMKELIKTDNGEFQKSKEIVLRCGNPACGKILKNEVSNCPYCGCHLDW